MRVLTLLLYICLAFPVGLSAQSAGDLLQKVTEALSAGKDNYAISLFRQAADAGVDQTEMYYWTSVDKTKEVTPRLAQQLAVRYKSLRNYDKAYLFYKEVLQYRPQVVSIMVACAGMEMMRGQEKNAVKLYENILALDPNNLQANIFLGNYYYLQAEQDKKKLEDDYKKISEPTRMQYARYRNNLSDVFNSGYAKARTYLQRVLQLFPSAEAGKTLDKIKKTEIELH